MDGAVPQLVTSMGYVSGMATDGRYLYLGTSYADHTGVYTYRAGDGGVFALPISELFRKPWNPMRFTIWEGPYKLESSGIKGWFGGIPLKGFSIKRLKVHVDSTCELRVREYSLRPRFFEDNFHLSSRWNRIDLSNYYDIVAFGLSAEQGDLLVEVILEP
jgi:hypothetical protein